MIELAYVDEADNLIRHGACGMPVDDCGCTCDCGALLGDCNHSEAGNDYSGYPEGFTCTQCGADDHYSLSHY